MKKIFLSILIIVSLNACKNDKKESKEFTEQEGINVEVKNKNILKFNINAIVSGNEEFTVYYLDVDDKEISKKRSVSKKIIGSEIMQTINFDFPENVIPIKILFMTGKNQETKIDIIDASFEMDDVVFEIPGDKFFDYFNPNKFIEYNRTSSSYSLKVIEGEFNPMFFSRIVLIDRLEMFFY
ncbi:hypothetical protein DFR65_101568 [Oceanihabitans sediminis]|uniref:Uncharacterized protein n=1 Tax=Oceanihabitans sediminis TaxID=1812012 RepID=A0A368P8A0_9FLAO|nr:hypothetical protein [Oceanihabitans sediminis]RBP34671.1 hypothetical protein DFR65_101568 [Oceanihabitans sediminis]RCU58324.1 hypothetical protein DU428_02820 [Oceanihabitans sediminis]